MVRRTTLRPRGSAVWLMLLAACSNEHSGNEREAGRAAPYRPQPALPSAELIRTFDEARLAEMTREEIWALGVRHLYWRPVAAPADWTKEELIERFLVDERFKDFRDAGEIPPTE